LTLCLCFSVSQAGRDPSGDKAIIHWNSYEKIAESLDQLQLDEAHYRMLEKIPWVVTEKIHGAHFCIVTDGRTISGASRKHLLAAGETFFEYQRVLQRLEQRVYQLFQLTSRVYPQLGWLSLYGELYGGCYPHPDISPVAGLQPIQTGIYYTPDLEFCAFDLAISGSQLAHTYLDYDQSMALLQHADLPYALPLLIGSYQEALNFPIEFTSTIPALSGLPPLPQENKAEGVVLKPLKALIISTTKGPVRPVFKRKIAAFAEDKRFHQAQKWSLPPVASYGTLALLTWEAFNQLTENRLRSAISKIGYRNSREPSQSHRLFQLFIADVLEELETNQPDLFATLTAPEKLQLLGTIQEESRKLLKHFFQQETRRM
jgi:Rnl2 family RNA ligase